MKPEKRNFPVDYSEEELIKKIYELNDELNTKIYEGERENIIRNIRIGQNHLFTLSLQKNIKEASRQNNKLQKILDDNKVTSKNNKIISGLMIIIAIITLIFQVRVLKNENNITEFKSSSLENQIKVLNKKKIDILSNIEHKLDKISNNNSILHQYEEINNELKAFSKKNIFFLNRINSKLDSLIKSTK